MRMFYGYLDFFGNVLDKVLEFLKEVIVFVSKDIKRQGRCIYTRSELCLCTSKSGFAVFGDRVFVQLQLNDIKESRSDHFSSIFRKASTC